MASYDLLGLGVCHVWHEPDPNAIQHDSFFGVTGVTALDGGGRGRVFRVEGVWVAPDISTLMTYEAALLSYADGVGRLLIDNAGREWPWVLFEGHYHPNPEGPYATDQGWCLPFKCEFRGLA